MGKSLEKYGITEAQWSQSKKVDFGSELDAAQAEAKAWKTVWSAGHGVAAIHDVVSVKDLIKRMKEEFKIATKTLNDALNKYTI